MAVNDSLGIFSKGKPREDTFTSVPRAPEKGITKYKTKVEVLLIVKARTERRLLDIRKTANSSLPLTCNCWTASGTALPRNGAVPTISPPS